MVAVATLVVVAELLLLFSGFIPNNVGGAYKEFVLVLLLLISTRDLARFLFVVTLSLLLLLLLLFILLENDIGGEGVVELSIEFSIRIASDADRFLLVSTRGGVLPGEIPGVVVGVEPKVVLYGEGDETEEEEEVVVDIGAKRETSLAVSDIVLDL